MTTLRRRCRALVDVDVQLHPIDPLAAARHWRLLMKPGPASIAELGVSQLDYVASQQRLMDGLLRDEATLDAWLKNEVGRTVGEGDICNFYSDTLAYEILAPVIRELPTPDRAYFEHMLATDRFYEAADGFLMACTANVVSLMVEDVGIAHRRDAYLHVDQRYRAYVDIDVEIAEIEVDAMRQHLDAMQTIFQIELDVAFSEYVAHQRSLVDTLLRNEAVLSVWLRDLAFEQLADWGARAVRVHVSDQDLLGPVIERMPAADREFFARAIAGQMLFEAIEPFEATTTSDIVSVAIINVQPSSRTAPGI